MSVSQIKAANFKPKESMLQPLMGAHFHYTLDVAPI
jgi:hypothetical protein